MLAKLRDFFRDNLSPETEDERHHPLQVAAAALLMEVSKADFAQDSGEYQRIAQLLEQRFDVDSETLDQLITLAESEFQQSNALHPFTRLINEHYQPEDKFRLLEALWHVALEDGRIDKHEEHLIRKIADLLYVPHREFIRAKLAASGEGGRST